MKKQMSKNKRWKILGVGLGISALLFVGATYVVGGIVYKETVGYTDENFQNTDANHVYQNMPEVIAEYETYKTEEVLVPSKNGYTVEAKYIFSKNPTDQTVVLVHGIGMNMYRHLREALMYLENGFNVVVYNQRYTGQTGGDNRSFGYYEQHDLASVVNHVRTHYKDHTIGAHGFSMGAGTVGMYSGQDLATEQVDFLILDCPYDTMEGAVRVGIDAEGLPIPTSYAVWAGDLYNRMKSGFKYDDARPIDGVAKSQVPMFIIHGEADTTCTVDMGKAMYEAKEHGYKQLWIEPDTEHVRVYDDHPEKYEEKVMAFINEAKKY